MIFRLFRRKKDTRAWSLYAAAVAGARQPALYLDFGLPDTPEGRFEAILLHVYLILRRFRHEDEAIRHLSQDLFDVMFEDMDESLREMGIGDFGISHRVKKMGKAFYGHVQAYDEALEATDDTPLEGALRRNLYRTGQPEAEQLGRMAAYVRRAVLDLDNTPTETLADGQVSFPRVAL